MGDVYLLGLLRGESPAEDFPDLLATYGPGAAPTPSTDRYPTRRVLTERLADTGSQRVTAVRGMSGDALARSNPDGF